MSGRYLLDTNAIIYALNDGLKLPKATYYTSIITEIELFSYSKLTKDEVLNIRNLLSNLKILNITDEVKIKTIEIRKTYGVKLSDSLICATALINDLTLISNDKQLHKIEGLNILSLSQLS